MWLLGIGNRPRQQQRFKRKDERFHAESLSTPLGRVKDLSASGLCISGEGKTQLVRGQVQTVKLRSPHGTLTLTARVAWVRKQWRNFEVGFELLDVKPSTAEVLRQLGQFGFLASGFSTSAEASSQQPRKPEQSRKQRGRSSARSSFVGDPYAVLGVPAGASEQELRQAYRRLVKQLHPDANKAPDAAQQLERVVLAYKSLTAGRTQNAHKAHDGHNGNGMDGAKIVTRRSA